MTPSSRIKDIAKLAGVSIGTVDRVLHGRGNVSVDAQKKVEAALAQLNYKPNTLASSLRTGKKVKITVLIPENEGDEYWQKVEAGVRQETKNWGPFNPEIQIRHFDIIDHKGFIDVLTHTLNEGPSGLIVAPVHYNECLQVLSGSSKLPIVLFNSNIPEISPISFIGQNLAMSGRTAASLMHTLNPNGGLMAVIHADEDYADSPHLKAKERGFIEFFEGNPNYRFQILALNGSKGHLLDETRQLAASGQLKGIFVTTSNGTSLIGEELKRLQIKNVCFIGYDLLQKNVELLREGVIQFLINQNPERLGGSALDHMLHYLFHQKEAPAQDLFPIDIVTSANVDSYLH